MHIFEINQEILELLALEIRQKEQFISLKENSGDTHENINVKQ